MVQLDWEHARRNGVTFVSATVTNTRSTSQTVRLESRLDGPTWPPRDRDSALAWTGDRWTGTVGAGRRCGAGFASPAPPAEPPLELVDACRASDPDRRDPDAVLAGLEAWAPTRDVLSRPP